MYLLGCMGSELVCKGLFSWPEMVFPLVRKGKGLENFYHYIFWTIWQ